VASRLPRFAWSLLAYNIAVILWGAYVRASGSGAGCGSHWPLCNGEVIPRLPATATLIEFSHRLTSGLALIGVVILYFWTRRERPAGDAARRGAAASVIFMLSEAGVGAGLVLFRLVADNASMARALFMAAHLTNTFVLLAALTLTAWWLSGGAVPSVRKRPRLASAWAFSAAAFLVASVSGAVAALGDTLYPSASLADGLRADLSAASHLLIRLRLLHPVLAVSAVAIAMIVAPRLVRHDDPTGQRLARLVVALAGLQVVAGLTNVLLLAPIWMQLVHLLLADTVWIALVLVGAQALSRGHTAAGRIRAA
jgi:heme a synthase